MGVGLVEGVEAGQGSGSSQAAAVRQQQGCGFWADAVRQQQGCGFLADAVQVPPKQEVKGGGPAGSRSRSRGAGAGET